MSNRQALFLFRPNKSSRPTGFLPGRRGIQGSTLANRRFRVNTFLVSSIFLCGFFPGQDGGGGGGNLLRRGARNAMFRKKTKTTRKTAVAVNFHQLETPKISHPVA